MIVIGVDIGTTTITALALDTETGEVPDSQTLTNDAEITSGEDRARGRSEWDASKIVAQTFTAVARLTARMGPLGSRVEAIGLTGQQHGCLLVDAQRKPVSPFINWQDRRGDESASANGTAGHPSYVEEARRKVGEDAAARAGCRLATGFSASTLYWMSRNGSLPVDGEVCFIAEYFGSQLTDSRLRSEPTMAASSGVVDVANRQWDQAAIAALGLSSIGWPEIIEADQAIGRLSVSVAKRLGLASGVPVFPALGDHQSSFLGSVADAEDSLLVNVGTGGQVAAYVEPFGFHDGIETRPFPLHGNLLVTPGLAGGRAYALLERFFRLVGEQLLDVVPSGSLFDRMNALASATPHAAEGLTCQPLFAGTRSEPDRRGSFSGVSPENFTPAHFVRALLEGAADVFYEGWCGIHQIADRDFSQIIGAGNGIRQNPVLVDCLRRRFQLPLRIPRREEEAAAGAALMASVGAGRFENCRQAGQLIRYINGSDESVTG